jgi:hypothetical protein
MSRIFNVYKNNNTQDRYCTINIITHSLKYTQKFQTKHKVNHKNLKFVIGDKCDWSACGILSFSNPPGLFLITNIQSTNRKELITIKLIHQIVQCFLKTEHVVRQASQNLWLKATFKFPYVAVGNEILQRYTRIHIKHVHAVFSISLNLECLLGNHN